MLFFKYYDYETNEIAKLWGTKHDMKNGGRIIKISGNLRRELLDLWEVREITSKDLSTLNTSQMTNLHFPAHRGIQYLNNGNKIFRYFQTINNILMNKIEYKNGQVLEEISYVKNLLPLPKETGFIIDPRTLNKISKNYKNENIFIEFPNGQILEIIDQNEFAEKQNSIRVNVTQPDGSVNPGIFSFVYSQFYPINYEGTWYFYSDRGKLESKVTGKWTEKSLDLSTDI